MGTPLQLRRDPDATLNAYTGPAGEITISTTDWRPRVHDGTTVGGFYVAMRDAGDVILHATGSSAAPGISFLGDTDTGIFSPGANNLAIATGGQTRFVVDASGFLRLNAGNILLGASGSGALALGGTYVQLKSDDGADRIQLGRAGTDNRIIIDLYDAAGGSSVVVRDNTGTARVAFTSNGRIQISGTQVVAARRTGWAAATGTATRTTFATSSVTLPQLAERVKALIDDLIAHGLIGA